MVLGEQQFGLPVHIRGERPQLPAQQALLKQLLLDPDRDRHAEGTEAARRERDTGLEQPLELEKRLVVERDPVDLVKDDAGLLQAAGDGVGRIVRIVAACA